MIRAENLKVFKSIDGASNSGICLSMFPLGVFIQKDTFIREFRAVSQASGSFVCVAH